MRRVAIPVFALSIAVLGAACSSGSSTSQESTTTTAASSAVTTTTAPGSGPGTGTGATSTTGPTGDGLTDIAFVQAIDELNVQLDFAKDSCDVRKLFNAVDELPDPSNVEQTKIAAAYLVGLFSAVGSTVAKDQPATAQIWINAARHIGKYLGDAKYAPAAIQSDLGLNDENVPGFDNAAEAFIDATNKCPGIQS